MGKFPWVCPKWAWLTSDLLCSLQDECAISGAAGARCSCSGAAGGGEQVRLHEASVWQIQLCQGEALQAACHIDNTSSSSSSSNSANKNNNNVDDVDNDNNNDGGSVALIRGVHHQHLAQDQNCNGVSGCQHWVNKQQQGNLHEQQQQLHFLSFNLLLHHHAEHSSEHSCLRGIRHGAGQQQQCKQYNHHHRQQHNAIQFGQHTAIATDASDNNNNNSCTNWGRGQSARALHLRCLPLLPDTQRTAREATDPQRDGPHVSLQCHRTQTVPDQVPGGGECVQTTVRNSILTLSVSLSLSRLSSTCPTRRTLCAPHWATIATRNAPICSSRIATTSGWTRNCRRVASTAARRVRPIAAPCWVERGAGPDGDNVSKTE